jgi:hypothetical protein
MTARVSTSAAPHATAPSTPRRCIPATNASGSVGDPASSPNSATATAPAV